MKEFDLIFDESVRRRIKDDAEFKTLLGYRKAIRLPIEILEETQSNPFTTSCDESVERAHDIGGAAWNFFEIGCSEHTHLRSAVCEAHIMKGTILIREKLKGKPFGLEVEFFRKNEKESFFSIWLDIDRSEAEVIDCGYSDLKKSEVPQR